MAKIRGIILERRGKLVSVLTEEGDFRQFKWKKTGQPGDRIVWRDYGEYAVYTISVLALFVIMLLISSYFTVAIYADIDFNPAVEMGVNRWGMVVNVKGNNEEAEKLISNIPWRGKPARRVVNLVLAEANREGYFRDEAREVVLVAVPVKRQGVRMERELINELRSECRSFGALQHLDLKVVCYHATPKMRSEAQMRKIPLSDVIKEGRSR